MQCTTTMFCYRANFEAILWLLSVFCAIFIVALVNYFILNVLRTMLISYTRVNRRISVFSNGNPVKELATKELEELVQNHWQTGNLILHLNNAFGLHILSLSGLTFVKLTLVIYFLSIMNTTFNEGKRPVSLNTFLLALYSMSTLLVDFLQMCVASEQVDSQVS